MDDAIGRVLAALDELGLAEDTAVLFTSDHGDMLGDHGLSQKNVPYEPAVRVPLILHWPGRTTPGTVCDDLVGLTDVLPTLIHELKLPYPAALPPLPGSSLLGRTGGGLAEQRMGYMIDYGDRHGRWVCLRTRTHKCVLWADNGTEELYDLVNDPNELSNIAAEAAGLAGSLRDQVLAWEHGHGLPESFDGDTFRTFPGAPVPDHEPKGVSLNEGKWADNLPADEQGEVETFAEAFSRAVARETSLSPAKLSLADYKRKGGPPLTGTPWEDAWRRA